jgi:hypothetical protein
VVAGGDDSSHGLGFVTGGQQHMGRTHICGLGQKMEQEVVRQLILPQQKTKIDNV